jgi:glyoxylase-like metal-dependent hydrolase (beta-lactamase superfamily II)
VRAVSLHPDVVVVTSRLLQTNCTIVRGPAWEPPRQAAFAEMAPADGEGRHVGEGHTAGGREAFVLDSPILPDELGLLPALLEQTEFPPPSGLLATHGDWDHLLGRLAFPGVALGCAESTAARLRAEPGAAQRELRTFDAGLYLERDRPLALGSIQALAVPGRCEIGDAALELYPADGHTRDGMAVWIPWARVLVAGDYLSSVELPVLGVGGVVEMYLATLERLRPLVGEAEHVVPGHGPVLEGARALAVLEEDVVYLKTLRDRSAEVELPVGRRNRAQRELHENNVLTSQVERGSALRD